MLKEDTYTIFELPVTGQDNAVLVGRRVMRAGGAAWHNGLREGEEIEVFRTKGGKLAFYRSFQKSGVRELKEFDSAAQASSFLGSSNAARHVKEMFGVWP